MATTARSIPTTESVLASLTQQRILDLSRTFGVGVHADDDVRKLAKKQLVATLGTVMSARLPAVLEQLGRDELRIACRAHGLPESGRARRDFQARLLAAAGLDATPAQEPAAPGPDDLPRAGQLLLARHRQWLVEETIPAPPGAPPGESAVVKLVCLDDDAAGRPLEILWDLELGARVLTPHVQGLGAAGRPPERLAHDLAHHHIDRPAHFGAYLYALQWSAVSAADPNRFQAPFRAGIKLMAHQLTPLMKALELPRANLFIADDVGLGKTIEAGLVLQELILRQQADFVLVVCPASVCLQWRTEMQRRFGLRFEVMTRQFIGHRRRERGFGVNPWSTHNRFIVSYPIIRRPEYRDPLLAHLGQRARKGLLILDEAHVAAPASASAYAVDSEITHTVRDLAPRFDNRLFLSATPHNGHSNSFSALLEILDPVRFTRGVPITGRDALTPVMVRRLKRDLRQLGVERFPRRVLVQHTLQHEHPDGWRSRETRSCAEEDQFASGDIVALGPDSGAAERGAPERDDERDNGERVPADIEMAVLLARYTELCAPRKGAGRLVFINLQKRLLSSPEAFARTLEVHARAVEQKGGPRAARQKNGPRAVQASVDLKAITGDPDLHGLDDDELAAEDDARTSAASARLPAPDREAAAVLASLRALAARSRRVPDAKTRVLLAWMREHLCPAIGPHKPAADIAKPTSWPTSWTDRRVILFTEYGDTKRYLAEILAQAVAHTERGDERILTFHGGMGDDTRDQVQRAFNTPPAEHPVRILIATDAAREGINLQAHCTDLFHIDIPWNPARLDQRNGRIDRTLQPADEVRCHYIVYADRPEDRVMQTLMRKVETVRSELGSLSAVLIARMEAILEPGIHADTAHELARHLDGIDRDARLAATRHTVDAELEAQRKDLEQLRKDIHRAGRRLDESRKQLEVHPDWLRGVVDVGLELAGVEPVRLHAPADAKTRRPAVYSLPPELGQQRSWDVTLDSLRPPRQRDEAFWQWRQKPPRPVTFEPLERLTDDFEQLHLAHPLVKRILDRFLAQGFSAHDLSRVTAVVAPGDSVVRVVAYARLSLFGPGAARLHDEILALAAPWSGPSLSDAGRAPGTTPGTTIDIEPYRDPATAARTIAQMRTLLASGASAPPASVCARIASSAPALYAALWPTLEDEADAHAVEARNGLGARARREADELRHLLERQKQAIGRAADDLRQGELFAGPASERAALREQQRQVQMDLQHLQHRVTAIDSELDSEPAAIAALYEVRLTRLAPVGLAISWPETMT